MTGRELYETAMDIAGIRLRSGEIPDTAGDLTARYISLINILITENTFLNSLLSDSGETPGLISEPEDTIDMHPKLLNFALPYGLCALLLMPDDMEEATVYRNQYVQAIVKIRTELPGKRSSIAEEY